MAGSQNCDVASVSDCQGDAGQLQAMVLRIRTGRTRDDGKLRSPSEQVHLQLSINSVLINLGLKGLSANPNKCGFETFSLARTPYLPSSLMFGNSSLSKFSDGMNYLGVKFDTKLTWSTNCHSTLVKAKRAVGCLNGLIGGTLSFTQKKMLFFTKIFPIFTYCLPATYPSLKRDRLALERMLRFICRIVTNDYTSPYLHLLDKLNILPVYNNVTMNRIILCQKYYYGKRYQPPGVLIPLNQNNRLRQRYHDKAMKVSSGTPLRIRNSALDDDVAIWNQLADQYSVLSISLLKNELKRDFDAIVSDDNLEMRDSMRLL